MRRKQNFQWDKMTMGTCYYPEHWDKDLWRGDLQRMKAAGISTVRVAEFAWSKVDGKRDFLIIPFLMNFWICARKKK